MLRATETAPLIAYEPQQKFKRRYRIFKFVLATVFAVPVAAGILAMLYGSWPVLLLVGVAGGGLLVLLGRNLESIMVFLFDSKRYGFACPCGEYIDETLPWQCGYCRYDLGRGHNAPWPGPPFLGSFLHKCRDCKASPISFLCPKCKQKIILRAPLPGEVDRPARSLPELEEEEAQEKAAALAQAEQDLREAAEHRRKADIERAKGEREKSQAQRYMSEVERIGAEKKKREAEQPAPPEKPRGQVLQERWRQYRADGMEYDDLRIRERIRLERLHPNDPAAVGEGLKRFDQWRLDNEMRGE